MDAKTRQITTNLINLGTPVCQKIKDLYFHDTAWFPCYREVGQLFKKLKANARKFYATKTEVELLGILTKSSPEEIKDLLELEDKVDST